MSFARRVGIIGLLLSVFVVLFITMTTTGPDSFHGPLARAGRAFIERVLPNSPFVRSQFSFAANIVMFVPFGFFLGLTLGRGRLLFAAVALPMTSAFIEAIQYFLPTRGTEFEDVLANSVGGWLGLGAAWLALVVAHRYYSARKQGAASGLSVPKGSESVSS